MSEASKPTPGPWFSDREGRIWRRPPADLYENGGGVAGDRPIAVAEKGWYGKDEMGYPVEANATLIAEAGTVHHETGLTPRQMADRMKAVESAMRDAREMIEADHVDAAYQMLGEAIANLVKGAKP